MIVSLAKKIKFLYQNFLMIKKDGETQGEYLARFSKSKTWRRMSSEEKLSYIIPYHQDITSEEDQRQLRALERASRFFKPKNEEVEKYYSGRPNSQKRFIKILDKLYQDLLDFKFENYSSVMQSNNKIHIEDIFYDEKYTQYEKLSTFDLKEHTLGVFRKAISLTKDKKDIYSNQVVILAIAHDFGKCHKVREVLNIPNNRRIPHNIISGMYLRKVCNDMGFKEDGEVFEEMLNNHHIIVEKKFSQTRSIKKENRYFRHIYVQTLNKADQSQRDEEIRIFDARGERNMGIFSLRQKKDKKRKEQDVNFFRVGETPNTKELNQNIKTFLSKIDRVAGQIVSREEKK